MKSGPEGVHERRLKSMAGGWARAEGTPDRKSRLPDNWEELRGIVKARAGGRCEIVKGNGKRCWDPGTDCDHLARGDDHSPENLQWICTWHHKRKTSAEANAAQTGTRRTSRHPGEAHPSGLKFY